ncbi:MAG: OsmC family protein [Granulosicoccus sp.]
MSQLSVKKAVSETAQLVAKDPKNGMLVYKANTTWQGDVKSSAQIRNFEPLIIDEPAAFGGGDTAVSPADLILAALGSCQEIMYSALASTMDIPLDEVSVKLSGKLDLRGLLGMGDDDQIPPGFQSISYETTIKSPANDEDLKRLIAAVEKQCPILDTLQRPISVTGKAVTENTLVT